MEGLATQTIRNALIITALVFVGVYTVKQRIPSPLEWIPGSAVLILASVIGNVIRNRRKNAR